VFLGGWEFLLVSTFPNYGDKKSKWAGYYEIVWGKSKCSKEGLWVVCV